MECDCQVCQGQINKIAATFACETIAPFVKEILKLRKDHPFPIRYGSLLGSIMAYGQVVYYAKNHGGEHIFYSSNKTLVKLSAALKEKFSVGVDDAKNVPTVSNAACEFDVQLIASDKI